MKFSIEVRYHEVKILEKVFMTKVSALVQWQLGKDDLFKLGIRRIIHAHSLARLLTQLHPCWGKRTKN
jgi:hypothetical protein